jgi:hypothetical protein
MLDPEDYDRWLAPDTTMEDLRAPEAAPGGRTSPADRNNIAASAKWEAAIVCLHQRPAGRLADDVDDPPALRLHQNWLPVYVDVVVLVVRDGP